MKDSLIYIAEVALCLNLLYWIYRQFLAELSFFSWSRFFFLFALLAAFAVPAYDLPMMPFKMSSKAFFAYSTDGSDKILYFYDAPNFVQSPVTSWFVKLLFGVYVVGVVWFLFKILKQILSIYSIKSEKQADGVRIEESAVPAWSFFGRIIINQEVAALNSEEKSQVIKHEKTHAKQLHSIDTLFIEISTALLWFNPLMPKIKREIVALHEYLADSVVSAQYNAQQYSRLILKLVGKKQAPSLGAAFTNQMVSKRIGMLNRPPESELKKLRFLLVLPLIAVLLFSFSLIEYAVFGQVNPSSLSNNEWQFPLTKQFTIVKPYVKEEVLELENRTYHLSHEKVTLVAEEMQNVVAVSDAKVLNVWRNNDSGVDEIGVSFGVQNNNYVFVIDGLAKSFVQRGQTVTRGQLVGKTGTNELHPTLTLELWNKQERRDPLELFE